MLLLKLMLKVLRKAQLLSVVCIKSHGCSLSLIAIRQSVKGQPAWRQGALPEDNKLEVKSHDFSSLSPHFLPHNWHGLREW